MNKIISFCCMLITVNTFAQNALMMPQNIKKAYTNETRSADGKPGKKYWQNHGRYDINVSVAPPSKTVTGSETISYINNSPTPLKTLMFKLILNIHNPGTARQNNASPDYLTKGIIIDKYVENGMEQKFGDPHGQTMQQVRLAKPLEIGRAHV